MSFLIGIAFFVTALHFNELRQNRNKRLHPRMAHNSDEGARSAWGFGVRASGFKGLRSFRDSFLSCKRVGWHVGFLGMNLPCPWS